MRSILLLAVALSLILACFALPQNSYTHCKWFKGSPTNYRFYWSYNNTDIQIAMEGHTKGWIGVGISTDGTMTSGFQGSDVMIGWVDSTGTGYAKDYKADVRAVPTLDPAMSQDLTLVASKQTIAGLTTIEFTRKLNTQHSDDRVFRTDGNPMYLIWAIGDDVPTNGGQTFSQHSARGAAFVDLTVASTCPPSPPADTDAPIVHTWKADTGDFSMSWSIVDQSYIEITAVGLTKGWIGIGLSDTNSMFYSDMIVGWVGDSDNATRVYDMYCADKRLMPDADVLLGGTTDISVIGGNQVTASDGEVTTTIKFRRPLITSDQFDLDIVDRDVYVLYALGANDGNKETGVFYEHFEHGIVRMNLKEGTVNTTVEKWVEDPRTTLRSSHGALMVLGWLLFMTVGRFIAAYGRGLPQWWQIHVGCQALAMLCISLSLALILKAVGTQGKHFNNTHGVLGIVLVVAAFVQTALGGMAHFLRTTDSPLFPNQIHVYLGHVIWWVAIYNIPLGLRQYQVAPFTKEGNAFWGVWTTWLFVMVATTIYIFYLKWVDSKQKQEDKARERAQGEQDPYDIYTTSHYDPSLINQLERVEKPPPGLLEIIMGNKVVTGSLTLHVGLILALAILFSTLPNTKPAPPYHYCPNCTEIALKFDQFHIPVGAHPRAALPASSSYFCRGFDLKNLTGRMGSAEDATYHIVEIYPSASSQYASHMRLFAVPYDTSNFGDYFSCLEMLDEAVPLYGWSVGMGPFQLPAEAGIRVSTSDESRYLVLQMHYDNPQLLTNLVDSSGLVVKLTTTLRPMDAGVMAVGVVPSTIYLAAGQKEIEIAGICSADKTGLLSLPLNVFAVSHMSRLYGRLAWLEQWKPGGATHSLALANLIGQNYAEAAYDPLIMMSPSEAIVTPGDMLSAHCIYDTTSTNTTIVGGNGDFDELCWTWISYYPKTDAIKCSSSAIPYNPNDGHFRPDRNSTIIL